MTSKHGDEYASWDALTALRLEGKKYVYPQAVKPRVVACDGSKILKGSDRSYTAVCGNTDGDLLYPVTPSSAAVGGIVFPRDFFLWTQRYVAAAQRTKPAVTASAKAKVLWTLDVLAHITYGVRALNLVSAGPGYTATIANDITGKITEITHGESSFVSAYNAAVWALSHSADFSKMSWNEQQAWLKTHKLAQVAGVPLLPAPYEVAEALTQRGSHYSEYALRAAFTAQVQPWISGGVALGTNAADKADVAASAQNEPMSQGIQQWQLWRLAARGRGVLNGSSAWYLSDDKGGLASLGTYISRIASDQAEKSGALVAFDAQRTTFMPTFYALYTGSTFNGSYLDLYINAFVALNYDEILKTMAATWLGTMVPQPATAPIKITVGTKQVLASSVCPGGKDSPRALFAAMMVTYTDFAAIEGDDKKQRAKALKAIVDSPARQAHSDSERTIMQGQQLVAKYFPALAPFTLLAKAGMKALIDKLGAAAGFDPCDPPYVIIPSVFARSLDADGYRLVPDGSTGDVVLRMLTALLNYSRLGKLDLGLYDATWTQAQAQAATTAVQTAQQRALTAISTGGYAPPSAPTPKKVVKAAPKKSAPKAAPKKVTPKPTAPTAPTQSLVSSFFDGMRRALTSAGR